MNTFDITCAYMGEEFTITLDSSCCTHDDVLAQLKTEKQERFEQESGEDSDTELLDDFEVTDWDDVPEWAQRFDILEDLMPHYEASNYDIDVFEAAHDCDIPFEDVDEAYQGEYDDDEDFAYRMALETSDFKRGMPWPLNCIDWEYAAKELMYDYSESNGHYFRNL